jgi:hypothetical protein
LLNSVVVVVVGATVVVAVAVVGAAVCCSNCSCWDKIVVVVVVVVMINFILVTKVSLLSNFCIAMLNHHKFAQLDPWKVNQHKFIIRIVLTKVVATHL